MARVITFYPTSVPAVALSGTIAGTSSASGALTDGAEVAPDLVEDFSTYTSTQDMLDDPRGIYLESECFDQENNSAAGVVVLDTAVGFGTSDRSLRFDWDGHGTAGAGGTISRAIGLPGGTTEAWVEIQHRFASDFEIDNEFTGGVGYKFIFLNQNGGGAGRFAFEWTGDPGVLDLYPNDAAWGGSEQYHMSLSPGIGSYQDDQWHRYRMHVRLGGAGDLLAGQVDDGDVSSTNDVGGFTTASTDIWNIALGKNINQRPLVAQSNWWGRVRYWLAGSDPGWGW